MKSKKQVAPEIIVSTEEKENEVVKVEVQDHNFLNPKYKIHADVVDPFSHQLRAGFVDWIKIIVMSLTIAPLRLFIIFPLLFFNWILAQCCLIGKSEEDINSQPFTSWRQTLQRVILKIFRTVFFCMGFHKINVIGHQVRIMHY